MISSLRDELDVSSQQLLDQVCHLLLSKEQSSSRVECRDFKN